jgi:hypothetical protein
VSAALELPVPDPTPARVWILARPLDDANGRERFDFFARDAADGSPASTPFVSTAQPFPTARAAYHFAAPRPALWSWIVIGSPRLILPRYRGPRVFR